MKKAENEEDDFFFLYLCTRPRMAFGREKFGSIKPVHTEASFVKPVPIESSRQGLSIGAG